MLRLGIIRALNALPVYYKFITQQPSFCHLVYGKVTELNHLLFEQKIDISIISSLEYAQHSEHYYILPNLSVSCDGLVGSIYLFLNKPITELNSRDIIQLTSASFTSNHLLQYLLQKYHVQYTFHQNQQNTGQLLIADAAIKKFYQQSTIYTYDLGKLWKEETGEAFIFALWAVQKNIYRESPDQVHTLYQALLESKKESLKSLNMIADEYYSHIFPTSQECYSYFANLNYDLNEKEQRGFELFQKKMCSLNFLKQVKKIIFIDT